MFRQQNGAKVGLPDNHEVNMLRRIFVVNLAMAACLMMFCNCTSVKRFDYTAAPGTLIRIQEADSGPRSITVMPFMDQRAVRYSDSRPGDHGSFYLGFIPLMPYGWVEKAEPEGSADFVTMGRYHFDLSNDLADAAVQSLKNSNLFSSVGRANKLSQAQSDYIWRGKVQSTHYKGRMYSYGITYLLAPVLWAVGLPMGNSVNELWVSFELVKRSSGQVIWQYDYRNSDYINHWLYARIGQDTGIYPQLMKQAMNLALLDLADKLE